MSVKSLIIDPETKLAASVDKEDGEKSSLAVATRPLKQYTNMIKFFSHPDHGYGMNIACGFSGTPVSVHNGTDNVYWTASIVSGTWIFNSVAQAHGGTKSVDATSTANNSIAQFTKAAAIDLTGYAAITGWVYLDSWDDRGIKGIQLYGWDVGTSSVVGKEINLKNYIDIGSMDKWQKFVVSLNDLELIGQTIDALRVKTVDTGVGSPPAYYLDDIQVEENVDPVEFTIQADGDKWLHVNSYSIFFADACTSTLADATMPLLFYNKLLAVARLENGILYQRYIGGKIPLAFPFRDLGDILMFPGATIVDYGADGTNAFIKILVELKEPILLKSENGDNISFRVADNLTGLLKLVISANCKEERRVCF